MEKLFVEFASVVRDIYKDVKIFHPMLVLIYVNNVVTPVIYKLDKEIKVKELLPKLENAYNEVIKEEPTPLARAFLFLSDKPPEEYEEGMVKLKAENGEAYIICIIETYYGEKRVYGEKL